MAGEDHQQRQPIGLGPHHRFGADDAGGTGAVIDHHGLAKPGRQVLGDNAGEDIGEAARPGRDHDADRPVGRPVRARARRGQQPGQGKRQAALQHGVSSCSAKCRPATRFTQPVDLA